MATVNVNNEKDIRLFPEVCVSIPCIVSGSGVLKAGTPVGTTEASAFEYFNARDEKKLTSAGTIKIGVVLHDVDLTDGDANASVLIAGYVDLLKVETSVATALKTASADLEKITFMKGAK